MLEISHEKPYCLACSRSLRQCACRVAVVSMPIFFQLQQQQGQQPGQQQALGLQPVQPQQPLVSGGGGWIFWGGVRVVTRVGFDTYGDGQRGSLGRGFVKAFPHRRLLAGADSVVPAVPYLHCSECRTRACPVPVATGLFCPRPELAASCS